MAVAQSRRGRGRAARAADMLEDVDPEGLTRCVGLAPQQLVQHAGRLARPPGAAASAARHLESVPEGRKTGSGTQKAQFQTPFSGFREQTLSAGQCDLRRLAYEAV